MKGNPTLGNVNSTPSFSFKSSPAVRNDYGSKPGVSALMNPTLHNNVPESMVNSTARAPLFVRPFTRGFEKSYSEGDILFVKRGDERSAPRQHHVVANLPVMNYILRSEKDTNGALVYDSVDKILEDYNYFGILNNDMDTGSKWQRLLNVNVRGRSRVARLWAPERGRLRRGDCLWIAIIRRDGENKIKSMKDPAGVRHPLDRNVSYYEIVPMMDCCPEFSRAEFKLPVGIVSQVTLRKPHPTSIMDGRYVTETCKSLERIEVLMRI
jgi:hypothetical protein